MTVTLESPEQKQLLSHWCEAQLKQTAVLVCCKTGKLKKKKKKKWMFPQSY